MRLTPQNFLNHLECLTSLLEEQSQCFVLLCRLVDDQCRQIHVGSKVNEELDVLHPTAVTETHLQNCLWLFDSGQHLLICAVEVGVGSVEKKQFKALQVSIHCRDMKRPPAGCCIGGPLWYFRPDVHLGSKPKKLSENVHVTFPGGRQHRRAVVVLTAVRICSGLQQGDHAVQMFPGDSYEQRRLGLHVQAVNLMETQHYLKVFLKHYRKYYLSVTGGPREDDSVPLRSTDHFNIFQLFASV